MSPTYSILCKGLPPLFYVLILQTCRNSITFSWTSAFFSCLFSRYDAGLSACLHACGDEFSVSYHSSVFFIFMDVTLRFGEGAQNVLNKPYVSIHHEAYCLKDSNVTKIFNIWISNKFNPHFFFAVRFIHP